mgnify:CR=1 FL=1
MEQTKTEKDKIIENLEKQGYKVAFESNIPIFHIENQKDADIIRDELHDYGSFGFKYPNDVEIITKENEIGD